ncbi:MAG: hypothetical protein MZV70_06130 [Desulfobacterales bacterium]|nr:hypothetical protein [Desulfobacterales bacterium]
MGDPRQVTTRGAYAAPVLAVGRTLKILPSVRFDWYDDYPAGLTYCPWSLRGGLRCGDLEGHGGPVLPGPGVQRSLLAAEAYDYGIEGYRMGKSGSACRRRPGMARSAGSAFARSGTPIFLRYQSSSRYTEDLDTSGRDRPTVILIWRPENHRSGRLLRGGCGSIPQGRARYLISASYALLLSYDLSSGQTPGRTNVRVANLPVHTIRPGLRSCGADPEGFWLGYPGGASADDPFATQPGSRSPSWGTGGHFETQEGCVRLPGRGEPAEPGVCRDQRAIPCPASP